VVCNKLVTNWFIVWLEDVQDIVQDIQHLAVSFQCVRYCHVSRAGNNAAHVLARKALVLHSEFLVWLEDVPDFLDHVIQAELPHP
jgi:hypothetical protein